MRRNGLLSDFLSHLLAKWSAWPLWRKSVLALAFLAFLIDLTLRIAAPKSEARKAWMRGVERVGAFWTGIILSFVYFLTVAALGIGMKLLGKDLLDKSLKPEPTYWRRHEQNQRRVRAKSLAGSAILRGSAFRNRVCTGC